MKRCPECDSVFSDADQFCDLDGTPLVAALPEGSGVVREPMAPESHNVSSMEVGQAESASAESWKTAAIAAVAAVAIGVVLFLLYYAMTRQAPESSNESSSNSGIMQQQGQQGPFLPSRPTPAASASPSVEPSASPSAMPSPSKPRTAAGVELNPGAISTSRDGKTKRGPVIIRLTDGASIEADDAWQTREGIWYRRGGIITLLDPKRVKAMEQVAVPTPQPSPSQSPAP